MNSINGLGNESVERQPRFIWPERMPKVEDCSASLCTVRLPGLPTPLKNPSLSQAKYNRVIFGGGPSTKEGEGQSAALLDRYLKPTQLIGNNSIQMNG